MKSLFISIALCALSLTSFSQLDLEGSVPTNYSVTSGSLSISNSHYRAGQESLKWDYLPGDTLRIDNIPIQQNLLWAYAWNHHEQFVYNESPVEDTLKVDFYNASNANTYNFQYNVNYKGWRRITRSFSQNMNLLVPNIEIGVERMEIVVPISANGGTLYFDNISYIKQNTNEYADAQMPFFGNTGIHDLYVTEPIIPTNTPTADELADLELVKQKCLQSANQLTLAPTAGQLSTANADYDAWNIVETGDQIKGGIVSRPSNIQNPFIIFSRHYLATGDIDSRNKARNLVRLMLDSGVAGGSNLYLSGAAPGYAERAFFTQLMGSSELFTEEQRAEIYDLLTWSLLKGVFSQPDLAGRYNTDNIHVLYNAYFCLAFYSPNDEVAIQNLKLIKRFYDGFCQHHPGLSDALKLDGTGFHHRAHDPSYMYAYSSFTEVLGRLDETQYQISEESYDFFRLAVLTIFEHSNGVAHPISSSGRAPFGLGTAMSPLYLRRLAYIGGNIKGTVVDNTVAEFFNYYYSDLIVGPIPEATTGAFPNGLSQHNFGQLALYMQNGWAATVNGMNQSMWGTEIYATENRYGRYQSYGTLEIVKEEGFLASKKSKLGYDWNRPNGATSKILPDSLLVPAGARSDIRNLSNFAAALRFKEKEGDLYNHNKGDLGMYGIDFQEMVSPPYDSTFKFKKSFFFFDDMILSLGSNIKCADDTHPVETTVYQRYLEDINEETVINGTIETGLTTIQTVAGQSNWMLDNAGNGFIVESGDAIDYERKNFDSPNQSGNGTLFNGDQARASINHGVQPNNASFEYLVIPQTNQADMNNLYTEWTTEKPYIIHQQDSAAHIVEIPSKNIVGYTLFEENTNLNNSLKLVSNDTTALVMYEEIVDTLAVTVVGPELNFTGGYEIVLEFKGLYNTIVTDSEVTILSYSDTSTFVSIDNSEGKPYDFKLFTECSENINIMETIDVCFGDSTMLYGEWITAAGEYQEVITDSFGCDSVNVTEVVILDELTVDESISICNGESAMINGVAETTAGIYTEIYTAVTGCDSTKTIELTVDALNIPIVESGGILSTDYMTNGMYTWIDCETNTTIASGAAYVNYTPTENGEYAVVFSQGSCADTSDCIQFQSLGLSINTLNDVVIFPNPATDNLKIRSSENSNLEIQGVYDAQMKLVKVDFETEGNLTSFDISNLSEGIYFISIKRSQVTSMLKFVKE